VAELLRLVDAGTISAKQAKQVYARMTGTDVSPTQIVASEGLQQISDEGAIEAVCKRVLEASPVQAADLRAGKVGLMGFFVGQVMKATGGSANPKVVNEVLKRLLTASVP
jgi:Asp-tRNA(Asn)/Glu-tRNA(Gln) amidotransferase B subunit